MPIDRWSFAGFEVQSNSYDGKRPNADLISASSDDYTQPNGDMVNMGAASQAPATDLGLPSGEPDAHADPILPASELAESAGSSGVTGLTLAAANTTADQTTSSTAVPQGAATLSQPASTDSFPLIVPVALVHATQGGAPLSGGPLTGANADSEATYISGVTAAGTIAATTASTWNGDTPATYDTTNSSTDKWGSSAIGTTGGTVYYYFDPASTWTATEKAQFTSGLALWSAEVNIQFAETTNSAAANFSFTRGPAGSGAFWSGMGNSTTVGSTTAGSFTTGNTISLDTTAAGFGPLDGSFNTYGGYVWQTIVHEEGHMLGLGHGGAYNGSVVAATQQQSIYDTRLYAIMSYIDPFDTTAKYYASYPVTGTTWGLSQYGGAGYYNEPTTPQMIDILAAQRIYGAATSGPLSGGQTFGFNSNIAGPVKQFFDFTVNAAAVVTLWDAGTGNKLDLSGWSANETVNLTPGTFSSLNGHVNDMGIALGVQINAFVGGAGNDTVTGNNFGDTFYGSAGNDVYTGGTGTDTADYSSYATAVVAHVSGGNGTIGKLGATDTLTSIERIVGGSGNDVFYVDGGEQVAGNAGFNTLVESTGGVTFNLGDSNHTSIQEVVLAGGTDVISVAVGDTDFTYLYGGSGTDTLTTGGGGGYVISTGGVNHMYGGGGTNVFIGGVGVSDMHGGTGNNVYYTSASDTVSGSGTFNTDVLLATDVTLSLGANHVQEVILNGGTNTLDMTGSSDFVYLYGGAGRNTMTLGAGGGYELSTGGTNHMFGGTAGTDVFVGGVGASDMHGGNGNNLYYTGASDTVAGGGTYNTLIELAQNVHLTLGSAGLTGVQQVILNGGTNAFDGSTATQQLIIYGGAGADTIKGGSGNDYFWGGGGSNTFQFQAAWGTDNIQDWAAGTTNHLDLTALAAVGVHAMTDLTQSIVNGSDVITSSHTGSNSITLFGYAATLTAGSFVFA